MTTILSLPVSARHAPSPATSDAPPLAWLNALTIDVEDYYHVTGFEHFVDRSRWGDFESRVESNTRRLLEHLAAASVRAAAGSRRRRRP